jgi:hypothetical protein
MTPPWRDSQDILHHRGEVVNHSLRTLHQAPGKLADYLRQFHLRSAGGSIGKGTLLAT